MEPGFLGTSCESRIARKQRTDKGGGPGKCWRWQGNFMGQREPKIKLGHQKGRFLRIKAGL